MEQLRQLCACFGRLRLGRLRQMWPVGSCIQACIHPRLMASHNSMDDSNWEEVKRINCYAMFMGYLWMAMRGLGLLVVTWTTVVLLGGFVSMLDTKDFWCLTVITLVQTAGVFNIHPSENLSAIPRLCLNFLHTMNITITWKGGRPVGARKLVAFGVGLIQAMVFSIILCPVAALYGFGLYLTTAIALWRLIEHDYGISGGETTNMNPAISVLYILVVLQGVVFCYRGLLRFAGKRIANQVAQEYMFQQGVNSPVWDYLEDARIGCEKDPSFAIGRNLITYAVNLMDSHSPDDLLSATRILDTLVTYDESLMVPGSPESWEASTNNGSTTHQDQKGTRIRIVTERLIGSSSSGKILQKLLKALDSRSPCDAEMRKRATRIVLSLAGNIRLKQFPEGIGCISSLLDASLHEVSEYKELMLQGLLIMEQLAADKDNCRVMSGTDGLVSMVIRPLTCDLLHLHRFTNHDEWSKVVDASLRVICTWLSAATGKAGEKPCGQIALHKQAISAMETILSCPECPKERLILAMKVLITQIQDQENIIVQLLGIFIGYKKDDYIPGLAGEKLCMLSIESKSNAKAILKARYAPVEGILGLICMEGKGKIRTYAAGILEGLCSHYIASHLGENEQCFEKLRRLIISSMPKLLLQILPAQPQRATNVSQNTDIERQNATAVSSNNAQNCVQPEDMKLKAALLSLCFTVYHKMINKEYELHEMIGRNSDAVCSKDTEFNFPKRLSEMIGRNSDSTVVDVDCLRIVKYTAKMAKSMMRHKHFYSDEDLVALMNSLDKACTEMRHVDAFVHLSGGHATDTLGALVKEARQLFNRAEQGQSHEVSVKENKSENTEQGLPSSGSSDDGTLSYLPEQFRSTEEEQQAEDPNKGKEPEIMESSGDVEKGDESEIIELSAPCTTFQRGQSSKG